MKVNKRPLIFNNEVLEKAIIMHAKTIPGIKEVKVDFTEFKTQNNRIIIDTWVNEDFMNVKPSMYELQKLIHYNLLKKFSLDANLKVDIIVHI